MDIRKIKKLIEMLQESDLREIEVSQGDESVRILRDNNYSEKNISVINTPELKNINVTPEIIEGNFITSPIVGTFYRKPSPDKDPFVKVGDIIEKGQVLCIIEAMKMMNEIKSEFSGTVTAIKVDDGEPVEFDQQLIIVG